VSSSSSISPSTSAGAGSRNTPGNPQVVLDSTTTTMADQNTTDVITDKLSIVVQIPGKCDTKCSHTLARLVLSNLTLSNSIC